MEIRNIRWPAEQEAIAEHIRLVHGPGDSDLLMRWYGHYPGFDPRDCFVIEGDQGEIAAHTMLIPRLIQIGEAKVPASEIGVVGTLETYRGRGYAHALIERALVRMTERSDVLGLILGIPNFYEQWGYEYAVGLYLTSYESEIETERALTAGKWDLVRHSQQRRTAAYLGMRGREVVVRPFYNGDLESVAALYDVEAARGHYLIGRDLKAWAWQLTYLADVGRYEPDDFLVAEAEGKVLGYVRVVSRGQVNWFTGNEAANFSLIESAGDDADATEALLAAVAQFARDFDAPRIGVHVHPDSQIMRHILAHGGTRRDFTGAAFLRLHDLPGLMNLLGPTLEIRLEGSPFAGRGCQLYIASEDAEASVLLGEGRDEVSLEAPAVDLVRLFTGWFGIDDLSSDCYDKRHRALLRVLFPKREPRIGMADIL